MRVSVSVRPRLSAAQHWICKYFINSIWCGNRCNTNTSAPPICHLFVSTQEKRQQQMQWNIKRGTYWWNGGVIGLFHSLRYFCACTHARLLGALDLYSNNLNAKNGFQCLCNITQWHQKVSTHTHRVSSYSSRRWWSWKIKICFFFISSGNLAWPTS